MKALFIIGVLLLLLSGCYEPLKGDLFEDYLPSTVIEAKLSNLPPPYHINVSVTAPPDGVIDYLPIDNAVIEVSDDSGLNEGANFIGNGKYSINNWMVKPNNWYHLKVTIDGKQYTADELMPPYPVIDSIQIKYRTNYVDGNGYYFKLFIHSKVDTTQYYRAEIAKNGKLYNNYSDLLVFNDSYTNKQLTWIAPYAFSIGDSVSIILHGISENMYKYYYGLSKQTTNNFSNIQPPMTNPPNNFNNHPLGYFQVSAVTTLDTIVTTY